MSWEVTLDYAAGPSPGHHRGPYEVWSEGTGSGSSDVSRERLDRPLLALKTEQGLWAKGCGRPLEAGKVRKTASPLQPPKRTSPAKALMSAQGNFFFKVFK